MQQKNTISRTFFSRTNFLAQVLGVGILDLKKVIGISQGILFSGRKDDSAVSWKTWHKLEVAEREAGMVVSEEVQKSPISTCTLNQSVEEMKNLLHEITEHLGHLRTLADKPSATPQTFHCSVKKSAKKRKGKYK